jgi:rRNA biogenesis protein RRP5
MMAPIKRKDGPTNESFVRPKKARRDESGAITAALRKKDFEEKETPAATTSKIPQAPKIAKARDEEAAFPRGGASVLTPLEHKQIQIEATRDVLFEQQSAKAARGGDPEAGESAPAVAKKKKTKGKGKKGSEPAAEEEDKIVIEGLNYKV